MNENIEVNNIIEVVNVGKLKDKVKKEGAVESDDDHPKNEEDVKYHESIINDIYGSMSDSEEDEDEDDDGEPSEEKQNKKLKREARKLQEEMKAKAEREQMQNAGIGEYLNKQVKEKVGQIFEQAKAKYQSDFNQEKVKGMFNNAYSKVYFVLLIQSTQFNDIVQKNNIQLPSIAELTQSQPKPHKTSLDQYLKISQPEAKKVNQETQEGKIAEKVEMKQEAQVKERDVGHEEKLEKKKTHFKINDGEAGENNEVSEKDDESEGEEFQDSEDEPDKQLEKQKENKVNDPLTQQMHTVTLEEEQKTLSTEDSLNPTHREMNNSSHHKRSSSWENTLVKGQEIDVSHIKLFQCKKESEKKNVIYQMVFNYETRYLSIIKGTLYSFELINIQPVLPFINNKDINTQNIKNLASRFFQSSKTKLFSYTSKQASDQVEPVVPPQVVDEPLQEVPQPDPNVKKAKLKGKIQLSRLFMIDITERGKKEIEIIMHFVNKHRNPLESPEIKRYRMNVDAETQLFLVSLEESIQRESEYYQIVMKEQSQRRKESKCYDLGDECVKSTASIYISECTGTNSTDSQCFKNYTITNADVGVTNYINVELDDAEWCYVMIQDNITAKYLKDTIANWVLNTNSTAFVIYLEAQTPTINSTVLKDMNVSDSTSYLKSMTSGINNMISNYTHVIFAMNPYDNDTQVLFSIQYTSGILLKLSGLFILLIVVFYLEQNN